METQQAGHSFAPIPFDPNRALTYDPAAGHSHAAMPDWLAAKRAGMQSGWLSTGFGLFQLLAPDTFSRMVGMPYPAWLIRAVGARDLFLGAGLLARPESPGWRTARFVNDLLDTTLVGAAVFGRSTNRRRLAGFAALAAAVILLDGRNAAAGRVSSGASPSEKRA